MWQVKKRHIMFLLPCGFYQKVENVNSLAGTISCRDLLAASHEKWWWVKIEGPMGRQMLVIWRFPEIVVTLNHPKINGSVHIFPYKYHPFWSTRGNWKPPFAGIAPASCGIHTFDPYPNITIFNHFHEMHVRMSFPSLLLLLLLTDQESKSKIPVFPTSVV